VWWTSKRSHAAATVDGITYHCGACVFVDGGSSMMGNGVREACCWLGRGGSRETLNGTLMPVCGLNDFQRCVLAEAGLE